MVDAARRGEKQPERDITVSHLDGDLSADDREELAGYRSGRCQLNSPWTCTIRASLLIDFVVFVLRPVELTVQNRTLPYGWPPGVPYGNDVAVQHRCYNNYLQPHGPSVLETWSRLVSARVLLSSGPVGQLITRAVLDLN